MITTWCCWAIWIQRSNQFRTSHVTCSLSRLKIVDRKAELCQKNEWLDDKKKKKRMVFAIIVIYTYVHFSLYVSFANVLHTLLFSTACCWRPPQNLTCFISLSFYYTDWCIFLVRDQVNIEVHQVRTSFLWIFWLTSFLIETISQ